MSIINLYTLSETKIASTYVWTIHEILKSWSKANQYIYIYIYYFKKNKEKEKVVDKKVAYNLWRSFICDCCESLGLTNRLSLAPRLCSLMADGSLSFVFFAPTKLLFKKKKKKNQLALTRSSWNKQKWIMYYFRCMFNRLTIHLRFHLIMIYKYWYVNLYSILKICSKHVIDIYIYIYILLLKANLSIAYHESNFLCWVEISDLGRHLWSCHCGCKLSSVF